jgi:UDP-N-acetylmuramate dehydrogenase
MTRILKEEPLWKRTTFRIGGPAKRLAEPEIVEDICDMMRSGEITLILGGGANLLASDAGVDGTTLLLGHEFARVETEPAWPGLVRVRAGAAARLTKLAAEMMRRGLSGLEFGFGIPGTLGGALVMNAGTREGEIKDVAESIMIVTREGRRETITARGAGFAYRRSAFPEGCAIVGATLMLRERDAAAIHSAMRKAYLARKAAQPLDMPSAGSVFKNPPGDFAGRLIEACGLKGERVGAALVSPRHANFIVNTGGASAADVLRLIKRVEAAVLERTGTRLEREIRLVGKFDEE